ncbi:DUF2867 domain-containing protein [Pseudonocardia humida]|uniref:DUF2867 domain-containing protein n=1 Tax=Pseudonocardia humida TaxID=2800819 RepID=A0ABT1A8M2_9PSEU|nr:DUF2867 domain-containing protein [Pseudonocardia humida]MCO1659174.1 DUF2867 domain-containing protein [Pseudonocardia humida]
MVRNVHERRLPVPPGELAPLLERLGGPRDALWPSPRWEPMVLDGPLAVGAAGGHGRIRYRVTGHEPGRRVEFAFEPGTGFDGMHAFSIEPDGGSGSVLRHVAEGRLTGPMVLLWPLVVRWLHDAVLEDLLDRAERAAGTGPARPARWSPWVRVLRAVLAEDARAREAEVRPGGLLDGALPRVDFADAFAVAARPGLPDDPQAWADAVFRDPPAWVAALMGVRRALVGLVGIDRGDESAFATLDRTDDEVLLGTDAGHLDFRASVRREPDRVVLSTVVRLRNRRGRAYFALVRPIHPVVVRGMLTRAARRLSRSSNTYRPTASRMGA